MRTCTTAAPTCCTPLALALTGAALFTMTACRGDPAPPRADSPDVARARPEGETQAARAISGSAPALMVLRCSAAAHAISPLIYGISARPMHDLPDRWLLGATARRWGGNHTTRYNWQLGNAWSAGKDWFFENVDYDHASRPADQRFIEDDLAHKVATALTVPMIGWVAKDTTSYGFPVAVFGSQQSAAQDRGGDPGNGVTRAGALIPPGSPERTSVAMGPADVGRWVRTIQERTRAATARAVDMYILDNEPTLWSETHRDVHPEPVSLDELRDKTIAYASEIRSADPGARIAGPALWGWLALFESGVDKAAHPAHPDRDRHGGEALLPWWLGEIEAAERRTGTRLVDVVDVHFYPQGKGIGIGLEGGTDADTAARRIRSTRALWDPTYKDESWIADRVQLIPRIQAWIAAKHPRAGVSIGEYNFGAESHMSGGLAVAEALGRFADLGVESAFYWDYPPKGSPAARAFQAYRDYDGHGATFLGESVPAESREPLASIFASRDGPKGHMVVVLLDLDPGRELDARIDASTCGRVVSERRFVYAGGPGGFEESHAEPEEPASAGAQAPLRERLPPYSMTVLDLRLVPDRGGETQ